MLKYSPGVFGDQEYSTNLYLSKQKIPCEREHTNTNEQCYAMAYEGSTKFIGCFLICMQLMPQPILTF